MAFVYLSIKNKEEAKRILEEVLEHYKDQVICYDIEELGEVNVHNPSAIVEVMHVLKKGGSLQVTLPKNIAQYMNLSHGSLLAFVARKNIGHVYITKVIGFLNGRGSYYLREQKE